MWIDVNSELPEIMVGVEVLTSTGQVYEDMRTDYEEYYGRFTTDVVAIITHWRPLPETKAQDAD